MEMLARDSCSFGCQISKCDQLLLALVERDARNMISGRAEIA